MPELKEFLIDKLGLRKLKEGEGVLLGQIWFDFSIGYDTAVSPNFWVYLPKNHRDEMYVLDLPEEPVDARNFPVGTVVRGRKSVGVSPSSETGTYSVVYAGNNRNVWNRIDHAYVPTSIVIFVDKVLFNPEEDS